MRNRTTNLIILMGLFLVAPLYLFAQEDAPEKKSNTSVDVSFGMESRHYFRGIFVSKAPGMTGSLTLNAGNFTIGYWGSNSFSFNSTTRYRESDFFMSYSIGNFSASLWDYNVNGSSFKYWDFDQETTNHTLDLVLSYKLSDMFPLTVTASTVVYGGGAWYYNDDGDVEQSFPTYVQLDYPVQINENNDLNFFMGTAVIDTEDAAPDTYTDTGFYGTDAGFGVVHTGVNATRSIQVTEQYSIPVTATIAMNPQKEHTYLLLQLSLL